MTMRDPWGIESFTREGEGASPCPILLAIGAIALPRIPTLFAAGGNNTFASSGLPPSPHLKAPGSLRVPHCRFL